MDYRKEHETLFTLFGATGDLTQRKVLPALFHLFKTESLPSRIKILALGRTAHTDESYRAFVSHHVEKILGETPSDSFLNKFTYITGDVHSDSTYQNIEVYIQKNNFDTSGVSVLYLSVSADLYTPIATGITAHTSLLKRDRDQATVCIEKPLGSDLETAQKLDRELASFFAEEQIYRIEHYLAKPFIQHIPAFRFKEALYEDLFSNESVASIDVFFSEKMGVENRGPFYDTVGAFRDVGQNHCLHMLASVCADKPTLSTLESAIVARADFLESALVPTADSISSSYRGQYDGYTSIAGVSPESTTETAFEMHTVLAGRRWAGVPVSFSGGKRMAEYKTGVLVNFKQNPKGVTSIYFESHPKMQIVVTLAGGNTRANYVSDALRIQYVGEYASILQEVFNGEKKFSITEREVEAMWKFVDPYCMAWKKNIVPLSLYTPDSLVLPRSNLTS